MSNHPSPPSSIRKSVLAPLEDVEALLVPQGLPVGSAPGDPLPALQGPIGDGVSLAPADEGASFLPTQAMVRMKARFWAKWAEQPLLHQREPTLALVRSITGSAAITAWWARAAFRDWFLNTAVTDERLDWLLHLALSAAEDILLSDDPKGASARVAMVKTVVDMAGRGGPKAGQAAKQDDRKAAAIGAMGREELLELLSKAGVAVTTTVDVGPPSGAKKE